MLFRGSVRVSSIAALLIGLPTASVTAQAMTTEAINDMSAIDIPLVVGNADVSQASGRLWVGDERPANSLLARLSIRPLQVATIAQGASDQAKPLLWRAFRGGGISFLRLDELDLEQGPRYFCGPDIGRRTLTCFVDEDGNGSFDHSAEAITERGSKPYHISVIKAVRPLDAPLPYQILANDMRPAVTVELRNCGRDYDRPRYAALSTADRNVPMDASTFAWPNKDSSFASCRRGSRLAAPADNSVPIPKGGHLAQIGPLAFAVGPKVDARLTLVGPADPTALYRLEGASLVSLRIGRTPKQAELMALKKFPYPAMMADEGGTIHDGPLATGARLATLPFHHAYRGKLTQDISIATLFGKRSLAAGTTVYGFPARSRITQTIRGIPSTPTVGDDEYRDIKLELTWCAPVHDADPGKEKPNAVGKGGWSAACIPHSALGNHTIITNLQPAFTVSGVSYSTDTSSNDGPPPIARDDARAFDQPLRIDYVYEGQEGEFVSLSEQIYFGGELTSSRPEKIYAPAGKAHVKIAGAEVELIAAGNNALSVKPAGPPLVGSNPVLTWDQRALLLEQLKKMGLKMADPDGVADDSTSDAGSAGTAR
jgi:hypothetical protein